MSSLSALITQSRYFHIVRRRVLLVAVAVGVAGEVEPGTRPALAVVRRGEQAIDDALVGVGRGVGEKGVDLLRASAAGRSGPATRGGAALLATPRARAAGLPSPGARGRTDRWGCAPSRVVATGGGVGGARAATYAQCCGASLRGAASRRSASPAHRPARRRPGRSSARMQRDLRVGQRVLVERHAVFAVEAEHAAGRAGCSSAIAGDDGRARHAALEPPTLPVEAQPARLLRARGTRSSALRGSAGCRGRSPPAGQAAAGAGACCRRRDARRASGAADDDSTTARIVGISFFESTTGTPAKCRSF